MRTVSIKLKDMAIANIQLGFVGENNATQVVFDCESVFTDYPEATQTLVVTPPEGDTYQALTARVGNDVVWIVSSDDVEYAGNGSVHLKFTENGSIIKSYNADTTVMESGSPGGGGGGGGTTDYNDLDNKPQINGVTLSGNKTLSSLGVHNVPAGGTTNQVLAKNSNTDHDLKWVDQSGGGGGGGAEIDDTAGEGDTDVVWSANKTWSKTEELKEAIENQPETKSTDADSGAFDITDTSGNVVARFQNGYIKTQKFDSTDPFELPSYYPDYLDTKCERIKALMKSVGGDGDAFIFITDQHMDNNLAKNTHHSFKMIKYVAEKCRINKLFCGGDLKNGGSEQYADEFRQAIGGRCYMANGNHEYLSNGDEKTLDYWSTATTEDEIGNHDRRYFYVDNPKNMVRYIVLSSYAEEQTPGEGASIGFEQDQQDWLADAMDVDTGWSIVIFAHAFYVPVDMTAPVLRLPTQRKEMLDVIDANANNHDVFIIQGHTHFDAIEETEGGFPILITACDKWQKAEGEGVEEWLHARTPGTITEHAFDVCVLDRNQRKITAVRVGAFSSGSDETDATLTEAGERVISIT